MKISRFFYRYIALSIFFFVLNASSSHAQTPPTKEQLAATVTQAVNQDLANTGDQVKQEQVQQQKTETMVQNTNTATTTQTTTVNANTGNNTADRNISIGGSAGVIQTGNVGVVTNAQVSGNTNTTAVSAPTLAPTGASTAVTNTGTGVSISAANDTSNTTGVQNNNTSNTTQTTTVNANTGNNRADRNISIGGNAGVIQTGSVGVQSNYLVTQNGNATIIGGQSRGNGPGSGASIQLANTGNGITASSSATNTNTASVENLNNTFITQLTTVNADTGNNTASRNISIGGDAGVIKTGAVFVGAQYEVNGGSNRTQVVGGDGSSDGLGTALTNTADGVGTATTDSNQISASVSNVNNTVINQSAFINANTGGNNASRNINTSGDAGTISTGNVGVYVSFLADFSKNTTYVSPTKNYYTFLPAPTQTPTPEPQVTTSNQPVYYTTAPEQKIYYVYVNQAPRSQFASYVSMNPNVMGAYTGPQPTQNDQRAAVAATESPSTMSVGGVSQLMVMLISIGALAVRKIMRV
ncbi:hypothetical protein HYS00_02400 [Candidatus Microgenomates bacterium]|nr:hypothetical protein [Candidatus Microgenomates bacterium]